MALSEVLVTFGVFGGHRRVADNRTLTVSLIIGAAVVVEAGRFADKDAGTNAGGVPECATELDPSGCVCVGI